MCQALMVSLALTIVLGQQKGLVKPHWAGDQLQGPCSHPGLLLVWFAAGSRVQQRRVGGPKVSAPTTLLSCLVILGEEFGRVKCLKRKLQTKTTSSTPVINARAGKVPLT